MAILYSTQDHSEKTSGFFFFHPFVRYNVVEKLPANRIFHYDINKFLRFDDIVDFDNMRMMKKLQKANLSLKSRNLLWRFDLSFFNHFDGCLVLIND